VDTGASPKGCPLRVLTLDLFAESRALWALAKALLIKVDKLISDNSCFLQNQSGPSNQGWPAYSACEPLEEVPRTRDP
jgi:hypothetical protein